MTEERRTDGLAVLSALLLACGHNPRYVRRPEKIGDREERLFKFAHRLPTEGEPFSRGKEWRLASKKRKNKRRARIKRRGY